VASLVVTVDACSWWSTADRGTGRSAPIRCRVLPADQATAAALSLLTASGFATAMTLLQAQAQAQVGAPGARYARLFPVRVRALVLDGPPDPQAMRGSVVESQIAVLASPEAWPFLALRDTVTASPVLVMTTEADPPTPHSGGVAIVAEHVTLYLVELRVPGGRAC
jgi:pimeloyl-ACP methyl ester carboxylesterase